MNAGRMIDFSVSYMPIFSRLSFAPHLSISHKRNAVSCDLVGSSSKITKLSGTKEQSILLIQLKDIRESVRD